MADELLDAQFVVEPDTTGSGTNNGAFT